MPEWKPVFARVTAFPSVPLVQVTSAAQLFQQIWNREPDSFQKQATPTSFAPSMAQGVQGDLTFTCTLNPIRVDLAVGPSDTAPMGSQATFQVIENSPALSTELRRIIEAIRNNPSVIPTARVALGVQFSTVTSSHNEANQIITSTLPDGFRLNLSDEEDFILQINQIRPSELVNDLKVNFITKWSVERIQQFTLTIPATGASGISQLGNPPVNFVNPTILCDNNNVPATRALSAQEQASILTEALQGVHHQARSSGLNVEGFQ
jgi:hypothetical protein